MNSLAIGINNAGEVVGSFEVPVADPYHPPMGPTGSGFVTNEHAFITGPNGIGMTDLSPPSYYAYTSASAINDSGQVAIIADYDIFSHAPYSHTNGLITGPHGAGMTDLGQLAEDKIANFTEPFGINNAGQVVGWSETAEGATAHAFITGPNGIGMVDLGTLGQQDLSMAVGINGTGQVTGSSWSTTGGVTHAFITGANGIGMTDLGALGGSGSNSLAYDINDAGQVVGWSNTSSSMHAFVTGPNGAGMTDLNSLAHLPAGVTLTKAVGINNLGQVVAVGYAVGAIPEPASYTLMLAGLALIGLVVTKKQAV
jgi:probable HAF family extracellular repeat protein